MIMKLIIFIVHTRGVCETWSTQFAGKAASSGQKCTNSNHNPSKSLQKNQHGRTPTSNGRVSKDLAVHLQLWIVPKYSGGRKNLAPAVESEEASDARLPLCIRVEYKTCLLLKH